MHPNALEPAAYVSQLAEASLRLIPHLSAGEKLGRRIVNQAMEEATGYTSASGSGLSGTASRCWKWLCFAGSPGNRSPHRPIRHSHCCTISKQSANPDRPQ
jgi:hypothetical protein